MNQAELETLLAPFPEMMTVAEVADVLRVDPRSIQRWIKAGRIAGLQLGRSYRIPKTDVLRWIHTARTVTELL